MQGFSLTYYYITNLQGNVMYLINASKNVVVSYDYDPYGKIIGTNDYSTQTFAQIPTEPEDTTKTIAELNPLRYRGYYYDTDDLGFYYLQSRYYDADICRFISADSYASTGLGVLGFNMFAYCNNDSISNVDAAGTILISTLILIGSAVAGVAFAGYTAYKEVQAGVEPGRVIGDSLCAGFYAFSFVYTYGMMGYQCYQHCCYLNGLTPTTEIGASKNPSVSVYGMGQAPKTQEANSIYYKLDNIDESIIVSKTMYNAQGLLSSRLDYYVGSNPHTHFDKATQILLYDHVHYFYYNDNGQPCGTRVTEIP